MFFNDNMVSNKTNTKTITTLSSSQANVTSDLIDMDEMLDQLEREESEHETENRENRLSSESDENFHKIEGNNFSEPLIEIDGEIVFCNAEIEQKVNFCCAISEIFPEVSTTSITKTIQNFSKDENKIEKEDYEDIEDIYNQIDEMDKLIKLEEEETFSFNLNEVTLKMTKNCEEKEENITMECIEVEENEINSIDFNEQNNGIEDVNYNNESEFFDKFVTNLVDELFDQAFTELITSKNIDVETKDNKEENVCVESNSEQCFELNKENDKKLEDESKELKEKLPPPLATYLTKSRGEFKLTESELTLGKKKPFWIPDIDCNACMLCSQRFSLVNRRHHCRACGRVLCRSCCSNRRLLDYMKEENPSNKQRVCTPCNRTLDRIEEYEKRLAENTEDFCGPSTSSYAQQSSNQLFVNNNDQINEGGENKNIFIKKSLLKPRRDSIDYYTTTNNQKNNELLKNKVENSQNEEEEEEKYLEELNEENKNNKEEINEELINNNNNFKKSVKFRDGVHPGQGNEINSSNPLRIIKTNDKNKNLQNPSTSNTSFEDKEINSEKQENIYSWLINKSNNEVINKQKEEINSNSSSSSSHLHNQHGNKLPKKISRRTKERKIMEEQTSLLQIDHWRVCLISRDGEHLLFQKMDKIIFNLFSEKEEENKIINNNNNCYPYSFVNIALRRNFHVKIEYWKNYKVNQKEIEILNFTTYGMSSIGVDELMIVLEFNKNIFCVQEQLELSLFNILEQFEQIFVDCLNSFDDLLDHRMGIRKCNNRIQRLYYLNKHLRILMGHTTEAIYFYRPQSLEKQLINLNFPSGPFLLGILVREEEIVWARCTPLRLLLRLGQISNQYPTPIINLLRDQPVFTKDIVQFSVLKVLNDFRGWTYQMTKIFNSTIIIKNNLTEIFLPKSSQDEIRTLIESNRNMVAWSLNELSFLENEMKIDSHLICEQKISEDGQQYFSTGIFKKEEEKEEDLPIKITCASFVIFDGALKSSGGINGGDKFVVNIVEDGLIIRLQSELMEELIKILLNNSDEDLAIFEAINKIQINEQEIKEQKLIVQYIEDNKQLNNSNNNYFGALISPIDGQQLGGQFQYGLQLQRQLISMNFFQYSTEWAIRLSTVINLMPGKWPSALQPRYFDVCEQLAKLVANTLEPFLPGLIAFNQLFIAMRINVDEENVSYETKRWESMLDQHFVWTVTLDDQIIPFLYSLCSWIPNNLRVELHMPILSIRSLPLTNIDLGENE